MDGTSCYVVRCDVGGQIESSGLSLRQRLVVAGQYLARDGDDAITVMVIEEVSEGLLPDQELRVRSVNLARLEGSIWPTDSGYDPERLGLWKGWPVPRQ